MLGLIGGTGLSQLEGLHITEQRWLDSAFGEPSSALSFGEFKGVPVVFLARHGEPHQIAPHLINYRANLSVLKQVGVSDIIAVNAVGGIHSSLGPAHVGIPDQIIDYTYGREHTIYDGVHYEDVDHIDFTLPYSQVIRDQLIEAAKTADVSVLECATYGAIQGPRLETAAEIKKLKNDGCDMVGMTGMPEAALAKEFGLNYACIALSVNWAAGLGNATISMDDIHKAIEQGMEKVYRILNSYLS